MMRFWLFRSNVVCTGPLPPATAWREYFNNPLASRLESGYDVPRPYAVSVFRLVKQ